MSYDDEDSGQLGIPAGGQGSERPAKSDSPWSHAAWSHALSRRGGSARSARIGKQLSWGRKFEGPIPSNLPKGAGLSPAGDLGLLRGIETEKVFPSFRKLGASVSSSKEIPQKEQWVTR